MNSWYEFKLFVMHSSAVSMDALHVLTGVLLLLLIARLSGWPLGKWHNCLALLGLELANEWLDVEVEAWPHPGMQYGEGAKDVVVTMILPVVLTLAVRRRPDLFRQAAVAQADQSGEGAAEAEHGAAVHG